MLTSTALEHHVQNFQQWWLKNYAEKEIPFSTDDASYPHWDSIHATFIQILTHDELSSLDKTSLTNLLWLIARNEDIGSMLAWLSNTNHLSNLGNLKEYDFIKLATILSQQKDTQFEAAKNQFAYCFMKLDSLSNEAQTILLRFFQQSSEHCQSLCLKALSKAVHPEATTLLHHLWHSSDSVSTKIVCLGIIDDQLKDEKLMINYINLASAVDDKYLNDYLFKLRKKYHC